MSRYDVARNKMLHQQLAGIGDERVLAVMGQTPRHDFVPEVLRHRAYEDGPLPISCRQTISQPWIVARMTELLSLESDHHVLEIGTGSGYQTAVLSQLCKSVVTVERHAELAREARALLSALGLRNVTILGGDGTMGRSEFAPYDAILVTAGAPDVPRPLRGQLRIGGSLVVPVGDGESQKLVRVKRLDETNFTEETFESCRFVPLLGRFGWREERAT
jgi:protein-L-isoaspartate(D-aspartate) O-methyltransferase